MSTTFLPLFDAEAVFATFGAFAVLAAVSATFSVFGGLRGGFSSWRRSLQTLLDEFHGAEVTSTLS